MSQNQTKLVAISGIFHDKGGPEGVVVFPESGNTVSISELFQDLAGREVDLLLHHFPPSGALNATEPGAGCCLVREHCRAGHAQDPGHLFSTSLSGVLERGPEGTWAVGATRIPLSEQMVGHYGRLIIFAKADLREGAGLDDLIQEASALTELLSSLRGSLKATT